MTKLGVPGDVRCQVYRRRLCVALLPEKDAEDQQVELNLAAQRYRDLVKELNDEQ